MTPPQLPAAHHATVLQLPNLHALRWLLAHQAVADPGAKDLQVLSGPESARKSH